MAGGRSALRGAGSWAKRVASLAAPWVLFVERCTGSRRSAVSGLFKGAAAAAGWHRAKHWWQKPFAALGGLFSGAAHGTVAGAKTTAGPVTGAVGGWRTGEQVGGAMGRGILRNGRSCDHGCGGRVILLFWPAQSSRRSSPDWQKIIPAGTRGWIKAAPYGSGPTHSQIAKDDPEHPLFGASRALAHEADLQIGRAIIAAWSGKGPIKARVAAVEALVDVFVAHPFAVGWWR